MNTKSFVVAALLAALVLVPVAAQDATVSLVSVRNLSGDPRFDYLAGMIEGILLYDLTRTEGVSLVDRASLDRVLAEQELQLSGLVDDRTTAVKVGKLLGAKWLLMADYVPLGPEVSITVKVIAVDTGKVSAFTDRGSGENTVHRLASAVVELLTGKRIAFADPKSDRSIVSLRDETPGSIAIHSIMLRGEIFLDEEFVGYTTGSSDKPFVIEGVRPGRHVVRIHVGRDFGVIKLPEVSFGDWTAEVDVQPGKRHVLRDETRHFNDLLVKLIWLYDKEFKVSGKDYAALAAPISFSFVDRSGAKVEVTILLNPKEGPEGLVLSPVLVVNGVTTSLPSFSAVKGKEIEFKLENGIVRLKIEIDWRYSTVEVDVEAIRTDIWQNMW